MSRRLVLKPETTHLGLEMGSGEKGDPQLGVFHSREWHGYFPGVWMRDGRRVIRRSFTPAALRDLARDLLTIADAAEQWHPEAKAHASGLRVERREEPTDWADLPSDAIVSRP